jgi:DNA-damage-inducible protein D
MSKKEIQKNITPTVFEEKEVRRVWENEQWYFAVVDIIAILTQSVNPCAYWRKLKERLLQEGGNETVTKCHALKMLVEDGKMRK